MLETVNKHMAKISLAMQEGDSIREISRKTGSSYGWIYKWIKKLEELEIVETTSKGIHLIDRETIDRFKELSRSILSKKIDLEDAYLLPNFSGMKYAYTKTDAVWIWTKGGYQIGRSRENYPLFIKILEKDLNKWRNFFKQYSIECKVNERAEKGIHFVLSPEKEFKREKEGKYSVIPLQETVEWAEKHKHSFQPALEMLKEMHDLDIDVEYREREKIKA